MKARFRILILIMVFFSREDEEIFDLPPSERNAKHISEPGKGLINIPYGWSVACFPRTDPLLFTNVNELIILSKGTFEEKYKYGYGGHRFLVRSSDDGVVQAVADYTEQSLQEVRQDKFEVSQNTFTQLSFTTYNYLHSLVNNRFIGSSDSLYTGKNIDGNLILKTSSHTEPAREYIVFIKLKSDESWQGDIRGSYDNKLFFEKMKNPRLSTRKVDRVYFRSNMRMNATYSADRNTKQPLEVYQRYRLFLAIDYSAPRGWLGNRVRGLGPGYVGTVDGLTFRPGIRYNEIYTFYGLRRGRERFVCELVKVFDLYSKTARWASRHLAPEGERTGVVVKTRDEIQVLRTRMNMRHIWVICLLAVCSCNTVKEDFVVNEDYEKLFPSKEIEKPANKRGELLVQLCDLNRALESYQYPGTEIPDDAEQYKITLICLFQEKSWDENFANDVIAQYKVKYVNEKKELVTISYGRKNAGVTWEDIGRLIPNVMYNGEKLKISSNVHSGFPLYLCVTGEGPRSSNIKASVKAVSTGGLIEISGLETEQYQNEEGINPLRYPYYGYLILP